MSCPFKPAANRDKLFSTPVHNNFSSTASSGFGYAPSPSTNTATTTTTTAEKIPTTCPFSNQKLPPSSGHPTPSSLAGKCPFTGSSAAASIIPPPSSISDYKNNSATALDVQAPPSAESEYLAKLASGASSSSPHHHHNADMMSFGGSCPFIPAKRAEPKPPAPIPHIPLMDDDSFENIFDKLTEEKIYACESCGKKKTANEFSSLCIRLLLQNVPASCARCIQMDGTILERVLEKLAGLDRDDDE